MRCGEAVSVTAQTGQSDDIHSPDACARRVVRRIWPVDWSIAVVWMVAISCWPRLLRTISRPMASKAKRKVRSASLGNGARMVAVSDFSGLISSTWALSWDVDIDQIVLKNLGRMHNISNFSSLL